MKYSISVLLCYNVLYFCDEVLYKSLRRSNHLLFYLKNLLSIRLSSSTPNHPRPHFTSLTQPLHNKILDHLFWFSRTSLFQHLNRLFPLFNPLYLFQTLQTLHPHTNLLDSGLLGLVFIIFQTHRHVFVANHFGGRSPLVQRPYDTDIGAASGDALFEGGVNVFAEFVGDGREVSGGEGSVHFRVEGFCNRGDGGGLEVCAGGDVEVTHVMATK